LSEDTIRDKTGAIIDIETLPLPRWKVFGIYLPIQAAILKSKWIKQPGELYKSINKEIDDRDLSVIILEVPDEITFPLPANFDWEGYCLNWLKSFDYEYRLESRHKLSGMQATIFSLATPKEPNKTLVFFPAEQLTESEIEEMMEKEDEKNYNEY